VTEKGRLSLKKQKIAWGITGSGDRLIETVEVMKKIKARFEKSLDLRVYLSKAGTQVVERYKLMDKLREDFSVVLVEVDSNTPFLAGMLQTGVFEFLLIAPATSNTVAKISTGIADSLLSNAAIMALKAFVHVYIMPSDYKEGVIETKLPNGRNLRIRIRKEDAEHTRKLVSMEDVFVLETPEEINKAFEKHFCP
jgi:archaeoflavoprotein AfpA